MAAITCYVLSGVPLSSRHEAAPLLPPRTLRQRASLYRHPLVKKSVQLCTRFCITAQASIARTEDQLTPQHSVLTRPDFASPVTGAGIDEYDTVPAMWRVLARRHRDLGAVMDPHAVPQVELTFSELEEQMRSFGAGLAGMGLRRGDKVALFSENSSRWLVADQGIMLNGAADAVRGSSTPVEEQAFILRNSYSVGLVAQDSASLARLLSHINGVQSACSGTAQGSGRSSGQEPTMELRFAVVLWGEVSPECVAALPCPVVSFEEVLRRGRADSGGWAPARVLPRDLATLVYTSGTTGQPKGVMLSHANVFYQVANFSSYVNPAAGDQTLSLLPPWHIYERSVGYYIFSRGCKQVYSNIAKFRDDLQQYPPHFFVCVPLVLDTLHSRVMQSLKRGSRVKRALALSLLAASGAFVRARRVLEGVALQYARTPRPALAWLWAAATVALLWPLHRLGAALVYGKVRAALGIRRAAISGGGSLAPHLDDFYESIGLTVINGWGLTETSPVLACRLDAPRLNVRGSVGQPTPGTDLRVVDPTTLVDVADGEQGLILARGPGVMQGYNANEAATSAAFRAGGGWFDTGDLGWRAPQGVRGSCMAGTVVLTGRSKDTIVLSSGDNMEPQPIEDALCESLYIKFAHLVGQDCKHLGALLVPNTEALAELASSRGVPELSTKEVVAILRAEANAATAKRSSREQVRQLTVLTEPFSVEEGTLTRTMKPRRPAIAQRYAAEICDLVSRLT